MDYIHLYRVSYYTDDDCHYELIFDKLWLAIGKLKEKHREGMDRLRIDILYMPSDFKGIEFDYVSERYFIGVH